MRYSKLILHCMICSVWVLKKQRHQPRKKKIFSAFTEPRTKKNKPPKKTCNCNIQKPVCTHWHKNIKSRKIKLICTHDDKKRISIVWFDCYLYLFSLFIGCLRCLLSPECFFTFWVWPWWHLASLSHDYISGRFLCNLIKAADWLLMFWTE